MKFTCRVEVNLPIKKVVELWNNSDNLQYWQEGFERIEHLSGKKNEVGSKYMLHYNFKGTPMELEETIIEMDLPNVMEGEYVHKHMSNRMRNTFTVLGENSTVWKAELDYIQFNGVMMKLFALFGKGIFRKQTQKWLDEFKKFAEAQ